MSNIEQVQVQLEQTNAHLEAAKQMLNEAHTTSLQLRANVILFHINNQELARKNQDQDRDIQAMNQKLTELNARIAELTKDSIEEVNVA